MGINRRRILARLAMASAAPTAAACRPAGHDVPLAFDVPREGRSSLRAAQCLGVQMEAAWLQAAIPESFLHDLLSWLFVAEGRGCFDEASEEVLHPSGLGGDGI